MKRKRSAWCYRIISKTGGGSCLSSEVGSVLIFVLLSRSKVAFVLISSDELG